MTAVQLMNIQRLLEAAEYLDRREKGMQNKNTLHICGYISLI
jgi:hypothetical protein